jgi:hypothetical protein
MTDYIGYDALSQAAMRGVMREALKRAKMNGGLPGDHHFYITFTTKAPGVKIASYLLERFPEDMTIVIQHQFWDLDVQENHFEIVLKFGGVPQHLSVPLSAVTRFVDPAVNFNMVFESRARDAGVVSLPTGEEDNAPASAAPVGDAGNTVVSLDAFRRK